MQNKIKTEITIMGVTIKTITTVVVFILLLLPIKKIVSQNYYEDSYPKLKDSVFYPEIDRILSAGHYDSVFYLANKAYNYYAEQGQKDTALYLFNLCCYYPLAIGMGDTVLPVIIDKLDYLRQNTDTNNVHYATLNHITSFGYKYYGQFKRAKPYIKTAVGLYETLRTPPLHKASGYYNMGGTVLNEGDFYGGYKLYKKALEVFTAEYDSLPRYHNYFRIHDVATAYLGIAFGMKETGQILLTEAFNKKAYNTLIKYPRTDIQSICEANLSSDYIDLEQYDTAITYADSALAYVERNDLKTILNDVYFTSMKNLGTAYSKKGNYDTALEYLDTIAVFLITNFPDDKIRLSYIYTEMAEVYYSAGNYDEALTYYKKAVESKPDNILVKLNLSEALTENEFYDRSIKVLKSIEADSDFKDNLMINSLLAKDFYGKYKKTEDTDYLKTSLHYATVGDSLILNHLNSTIFGENELKLSREYHDIAEVAVSCCFNLYNKTNDEQYLNEFVRLINQSTANKLNIEIGHLSNEKQDSHSSEQINLLIKIRNLENELLAISDKNNNENYNQISDSLTKLRIEAFELSYELQGDNVTTNSSDLNNVIDIEKISDLIKPDEAVIQFFLTDSTVYSSVITQNNIGIYHKTSPDISNQITSYYKSIKTGDNNLYNNSNTLYNTLFGQLTKELQGIDKLIIIPDGALNQIPFEPLITDLTDGRMLINEYSVTYNYSLYIWMNNRLNEKKAPLSFVGFAPVFSNIDTKKEITAYNPFIISDYPLLRSGEELTYLPFSGKEIISIDSLFHKHDVESKIYLNKDANEHNFKQNTENPGILHIATHGHSSLSDPELSCIYFSQSGINSKNNTNDGKTFIGEIFTMQPKADLVVLSACKSGAGKVSKGEGIMALPRAFLFAGVPNIISSLWKIHDQKTYNLMLDFYDEVIKGSTYAEALRTAKLKQINEGELPTSWSSIVLIGN